MSFRSSPTPETGIHQMNQQEMIDRFSALSESEKVRVLARWAWALTVAARDTYVAGTDAVSAPERLREFNEHQHRLLNELNHHLNGDAYRAFDEEYLRALDAEW